MSLGVNNNLAAQGILTNLANTQTMFNTQVERLSSGLRINRAADDPAGLVISEKYRAQIDGLGQAIRNARDGINLAQTAEGALDEISSLLRQMRTLALHAANTGPNDSATIDADQKQIESAISTIDRIANNTSFGTRKLLDGSAGVTGTSGTSSMSFVSGTSAIAAGTKSVTVTQVAVQGTVSGAQLQVANVTAQNTWNLGSDMGGDNIGLITLSGSALSAAITVTISESSNTEALLLAEINGQLGGQAVATASGNQLTFTATTLSANGGLTVESEGADVQLFTGIHQVAANNTTGSANAGATSRLALAETLTFSNGAATGVVVSLSAGTTLADAATQVNSALSASGFDMAFSHSAGVFTVSNVAYGGASTVGNTFISSRDDSENGMKIVGTANSAVTVASGTGAASGGTATAGLDVVGTIDGAAATGKGQLLELDGLVIKATGTFTAQALTLSNNSLTMQIGAFAGQTEQLAIGDMRTNRLGNAASGVSSTTADVNVAGIDVTRGSGQGAQDAIRILDEAIAQVSKERAALGSFQKDTLEATVRNSLVAQQNMRTTESNIRDANVAEETLKFSKAQILQQTGIAMLAQANQAPQQLLSLFR